MTRLVQTERALMDTRQQIGAAPKAAAPLADTRTIGKAATFTGDHKDWPEWSFQLTAYMGSAATPKSIEALRWAAMADAKITAVVQQIFEEHNVQLFLALALLCKGSALVTVKNTELNNRLKAWRGLNATYDSNKGRQRVRMQYLLQLKRAESILQTTEAVERWECDVREYEQRFGKTFDEDVKIGVILALAPLQVQNHCHLNSHILKSYAQVRTMLFDYCRAQADTTAGDAVPIDLSMLGKGGKARNANATRKGKAKAKAKARKAKATKTKRTKTRNAKAKVRTTPKPSKGWGHMKKDCRWNENAKSGKDTASLETPIMPAESTKTEPQITGMLIQSDEGGEIPADPAQWLYSVNKRESVPNAHDFLIDSGAATSVCQQSLADSLDGKPRGHGVELRSATRHQFTTTGNATICLRTRHGLNVASDLQIAPKNTGLKRSIISV